MKTSFTLLALAGMVLGGPAHGQAGSSAPSSKAFSFMGEDTKTVTKRHALNGNPCHVSGKILACFDEKAPMLVEGKRLEWLNLEYNRGLLWRVAAGFKRSELPTIVNEFTIRYGKPAALPAPIDPPSPDPATRPLAKWVFKDGTLQIESVDANDAMLTFIFVSEANRPADTNAIVIPVTF